MNAGAERLTVGLLTLRAPFLLLLVSAFATVGALAAAPDGAASTYRVTHRGDPTPGPCTANHCTLREAILAANASVGVSDTIVLPSRRTYRIELSGTAEDGALTGDLDITNDPLLIVHRGRGRATVNARRLDRVFEVFARATFKKLVIRGGNAAGMDGYGGGIRASAQARVIKTYVTGNRATSCGGGIHTVGAVPLVVRNSRVSVNWAGSDGGGISHSCFGGAGPLTLERSTVAQNVADQDGNGIGRGGGIYLQTSGGVQSSMSHSTWAGNSAGSDGGAIYTDLGRLSIRNSTLNGNRTKTTGGGIEADGTDPLTILNSTITANRADSVGGGIFLQNGNASLNAVTVARNRGNADNLLSEAGGGLFHGGTTFAVQNSLIALNTLGALFPGDPPVKNDCSGDPFDSGGSNLLTTRFLCDGFNAQGDRRRGNPRLAGLRDNGGLTKTMALKRGSPAINRANAAAPNRDQRGVRRRDPDIGAYERR